MIVLASLDRLSYSASWVKFTNESTTLLALHHTTVTPACASPKLKPSKRVHPTVAANKNTHSVLYLHHASHKSGFALSLTLGNFLANLRPTLTLAKFCRGSSSIVDRYYSLNRLRFVNFVRNPFELVVSGYLYHATTQEEAWWTEKTIKAPTLPTCSCAWSTDEWLHQDTTIGSVTELCSKHMSFTPSTFLQEVELALSSSLSGPLSSWMQPVKLEESFAGYLRRASVDAGLLAETIFESCHGLRDMRSHKHILGSNLKNNTLQICLSDVMDHCSSSFSRITSFIGVASSTKDVIERFCPKTTKAKAMIKKHSGVSSASRSRFEHPPLDALIQRLRQLDKDVLNGTLAALEKDIGCALDSRYA